MNQAERDTIYLISSAINDIVPDTERIASMDLEKVFLISSKHMVSSIVGFALNSAGINNPQFNRAIALAQRQAVIQSYTLNLLLPKMNDAEIWYMPLKGAILKDYYPRFGMREMADLDILVDDKKVKEIKAIMENMGFSIKSYEKNNVDSYYKSSLLNVEIHKTLFGFQHDDKIYQYFKDIKTRLINNGDNLFEFHFTPEDFYIYLICHEFKHFQSSGTGLRSLLDTYVFLNKTNLNQKYVNEELAKLGISDFEEKNRELSLALFSGNRKVENNMLDYFLESGTFGTLDHMVKNNMSKWGEGRIAYLLRRLFGFYGGNYWDYLKQRHPFFYQHKVLLPLLPFCRLVYAIKKYPRRLKQEIKTIIKQG